MIRAGDLFPVSSTTPTHRSFPHIAHLAEHLLPFPGARQLVRHNNNIMSLQKFAQRAEALKTLKTEAQWGSFARLLGTVMGDNHVVCLDGATGTSLEQKGVSGEKQWTGWPAQIFMPDAVREVHQEYFAAGASICIANSYASSKHVMPPETTDEDVVKANEMAARLAREAAANHARTGHGKDLFVAGSISNHAPSLPEGVTPCCETNLTDLGLWPGPEEEVENYRVQAEVLAEGGVDFIFLEMLKDVGHARRSLEAAATVGLPIFVGLTMDDERAVLRDEPSVGLEDAVMEFQECEQVVGFNIMHSALGVTEEATARTRAVWDGIIGVYPNQGIYRYPNYDVEHPISTKEFVEYSRRFENAGANMLGGCCGFDKAYIKELAVYIEARNKQVGMVHFNSNQLAS